MRPLIAMLAVAAGLMAAGCGIGPGDELQGDGVELRVTRDFGQQLLSSGDAQTVREGETVMRLLRADHDVETRYGGGFVQSIDGLEGGGASGSDDWFFYVNGIEADRGAADYELSPGDVVQWDYRDWDTTARIPAIVGSYPQPLLGGLDGKRFPVRVECESAESDPCVSVKEQLRDLGIPATGASLGAAGAQRVVRVVVAKWSRARQLPSARMVEQGPDRSGVFARFGEDGAVLEMLGPDERVVSSERRGAGLVAALRPTDDEFVWLVTGVDDAGVARAAAALDEETLRDAFALAVLPDGEHKLPLDAAGGGERR